MRATLAILLLVLPAAAQHPTWVLPADGAAVYRRQSDWQGESLGSPRTVSNGGHLSRVQPVLFAHDLDAERSTRGYPPYDLFDVLPFLAFDMTTTEGARELEYRLPMVLPYGDLIVRGRATRPDDGGRQTLHLRITRADADPEHLLPGDFRRVVLHYLDQAIDGELVLRRTIDAQRGLVTGFEAELSARFTHGGDKRRFRVRGTERWTLAKVARPGADFETEVAAARARGVAHLRDFLAAHENRALVDGEGRGSVHGPTLHAMALLALARAGIPRSDPVVSDSLAKFARRSFNHPNSLAMAILMTEAFHAPPGERARLRSGAIAAPAPRELGPEDRRRMRDWGGRLLASRDRSRAAAGVVRWFFVPENGYYDNAVTALAVQALYAAQLCGVTVDERVFEGVAKHLLRTQLDVGEVLDLEILPAGEGQGVRHSPLFGAHQAVPVAGWADYSGNGPGHVRGSVTAAVVAALDLCRRMLSGRKHAELRGRIDTAMRSGLAWLAMHHSLRLEPSLLPAHWQFGESHLLAMSQMGEQLGIERIQGRDWYFEGAQVLVSMQDADGQFPTTVMGTPVGVMFLRPASPRPITGPRDK